MPTSPRPPCEARAAGRASVAEVAVAIGGGVDGDGRHGDGSLEALRAGEIVECLGVW